VAARFLSAAQLTVLICLGAGFDSATADTFSFSLRAQQEQEKAQEDAVRQAEAIKGLVSVPCQHRLKNQRILLLIGEHSGDQWATTQERYEPLFSVIDARLRALGLKTYTQQQIKAGVAQAEVDAYFNNDPDAAISASKRLGANYILRSSISSQVGVNRVVQVNEVAVYIQLTLSGVDGHVLSDVSTHSDSYSGDDTMSTALALVRERADPLVAQLYNDYCRAGAGSRAGAGK
jgi:hypothetical protein